MDSRTARLNNIAPRHVRAQAAVWVADLHGPDRDTRLEARVRQWIAADPRHAAAFELATEAWQRSGNLPKSLPPRESSVWDAPARDPGGRRLTRPALAGVAVAVAALMAGLYWARDGNLSTAAGEQRTVELSDGTEVSLNANSRIAVQFDERVRKVTLARGEALFNVTKHQSRPFVVVVGERKVVALGTSFVVRREQPTGTAFAVTLVEGRVAVEPVSFPDILPQDAVAGLELLNPGERLRFVSGARTTVDSPSIDKVTAWRRGQLIFDDASLSEAAAEFNRYGSKTLALGNEAIGKLRVGGVFRIGDPSSFAQAMANAHHLRMVSRGTTITLVQQSAAAR